MAQAVLNELFIDQSVGQPEAELNGLAQNPEAVNTTPEVDELLTRVIYRFVPASKEEARAAVDVLRAANTDLHGDIDAGRRVVDKPSLMMLENAADEGVRMWQLRKSDTQNWQQVIAAQKFADVPPAIAGTVHYRFKNANELSDEAILNRLKKQAAKRLELDAAIRLPKADLPTSMAAEPLIKVMDKETAQTIHKAASGIVGVDKRGDGPRHRKEDVSKAAAWRIGVWRSLVNKWSRTDLAGNVSDMIDRSKEHLPQTMLPHAVQLTNSMAEAGLYEPSHASETPRTTVREHAKRLGGKLTMAHQVIIDNALIGLGSLAEAAPGATGGGTAYSPETPGRDAPRLSLLKRYGGKLLTGATASFTAAGDAALVMHSHVWTRLPESDESPVVSAEQKTVGDRFLLAGIKISHRTKELYEKAKNNPRRSLAIGGAALAGAGILVGGYLTYKSGGHNGGGSLTHNLPTPTPSPRTPVNPHEHFEILKGHSIAPKPIAVAPKHADSFNLHHGQTIWGHEEATHPRMSESKIYHHVARILHLNHLTWEDATKLPDNTKVKLQSGK